MVEIDKAEKVDYLFKFIIIGDTGVGKSCILNQYLRGKCKYIWYQLTQYGLWLILWPFWCSQPINEAHSGCGVWHEVWESQPEDYKGADLGHSGPREVQVSDT